MKVKELDKKKCSNKFLEHNFHEETEVNVKCDENRNIEFRGKKQEYRIIVEDKI
jgi:hypothetical protein